MAFSRSLLIKGIVGGLGTCTVCAAGGIVIHQRENIFGKRGIDLNSLTDKQLIDNVGLDCQLSGDDIGSETKECSVKDNGKINVKRGEQKEEGVSYSSGSQKLKVSRSTEGDYSKNLKFVVDSGDISLTKDGGTSTISKLDQYETYGISKEEDKFYLIRKTEANREKERELGLLGKCELPATGDSTCTFNTEEIKKVKFDGAGNDGITVTGNSTVTLKISKVSDTSSFPDGYRFTFTFPSDVTIGSNTVKGNIPTDFKIKKTTNSNTLTLEKAWSDDNTFTKKAGLDCTTNTECNVSSETQKLNVKVGEKTKENITNKSGTGKIKMEKDQQGYNQGLKFSITTGDVTLTGGTGSSEITKLEELETYEITEENGKYYLTKKSEKDSLIRTSLGLPENCNLPSTSTDPSNCSLDSQKFQNINFDGKSNASFGGQTINLKISKVTNTTDFPLGYRFTFSTTSNEATISDTNKIKVNIPTDFKIKKNASNPTSLSLEKAWTETKFSEKVGLTCTSSSGDICCSKSSGAEKLNVKRGEAKKENITSISTGTGKIKVEKDQEGYNQGLKFTITTGDVDLTGGTASGAGGTDLTKLEELETYEITEEGDKYYLTRKDEASKTIENLLGLPSSCKLSSSSCSLNTQELQKINFSEKGSPSVASNGSVTLKISTASNKTDFPLGYKFSLQSAQDITIKASTNIVKANITTDFKIKKDTSNPTNLSLEKAWDMTSLGKKVNLTCTNSGTNECTLGNSGTTINVKQDDKSDTGLNKGNGSGGSGEGKIKVTKDQVGYNQGFKFTISDASITLTGGTKTKDDDKIKSLDEYETYEIKEVNSNWYLVRKDKAQVFIKKELNIGEFCTGNFPTGTSPNTCNEIDDVNKLKKINFDNKASFANSWPSGRINIQLEINKDPSLPGGYKFTFNSCESPSCCLPGSTNAEKDTNGGINYRIKKGTDGSICLEPKPKNGGKGGGSCTK